VFNIKKLKTYVYIDGFNFYYNAVKDTPYKWLDLWTFCTKLLSKNSVGGIKYFTARVHSPHKALRQDIYLQALKTIPNLKIIEGHFRQDVKSMPLAVKKSDGKFSAGRRVSVIKWEEKGSDVNLGVHLLNDAWKDEYEAAVVISNDVDLAEAIRLVQEETHKPVGIVMPSADRRKYTVKRLHELAAFHFRVSKKILMNSQFPDRIPGTNLYKPENW
jgi:NYN domain